MLPTLTIFLLAALLAISAVVCLMFLSVGLAGPNVSTATNTKQLWQPPSKGDDTLVHWSARMASSVTRQRLSQPRSKATALELTTELYAGTSEALEKLRKEEAHCSARSHEMIGVMAPEVLSVAARLRSQLSAAKVDRVRGKAAAEALRTKAMSREQYAAAHVTCPLLTNDGTCAAYSFRPLFCRTDCVTCGGDEAATQEQPVSSAALARGIGRGLSKSLAAAGVDANRYELNSALVVALDTADASERWASGEPVFAGCKQFDV